VPILNAYIASCSLRLIENGGTTLHAARYHLLPTDLRRPPAEALAALAAPRPGGEPLLSRTLPTLLLAECVLVYMPPAASAGIVRWFADHAAPGAVLGAVVYEMFGLQDAFGRVMLRNLLVRAPSIVLRRSCS
jgi:[phosphatase 2A protein]-leucine-carboxy methyltransferase